MSRRKSKNGVTSGGMPMFYTLGQLSKLSGILKPTLKRTLFALGIEMHMLTSRGPTIIWLSDIAEAHPKMWNSLAKAAAMQEDIDDKRYRPRGLDDSED